MSWFSDEVGRKKKRCKKVVPVEQPSSNSFNPSNSEQLIRALLIQNFDVHTICDAIFNRFTLFAEVLHFIGDKSLLEKILKVILHFFVLREDPGRMLELFQSK